MTLPQSALRAFLRLYAAQEFWESHEVLEGPWRESGDRFTQALILMASAWVHWNRGNAHGVRAQLGKTLQRLEGLPRSHLGFDVAALRRCCREVPAMISAHPDDWVDRIRPLRLEPPVAPAPGPVRVEACVTTVEEAVACVGVGAHRLEVCRELEVGGLTPERELVRRMIGAVDVPVHVLVRPAADRWSVTPADLDQMIVDIRAARNDGAAGVVVGVSRQRGDTPAARGGEVDRRVLAALVAAARPLSVTFHRAFDHLADPRSALQTLGDLGVSRVLTSGGAGGALAGAAVLLELRRAAPPGLTVLAGGGVREDHVVRLVDETGVAEVHARAAGIAGICTALREAALLDQA